MILVQIYDKNDNEQKQMLDCFILNKHDLTDTGLSDALTEHITHTNARTNLVDSKYTIKVVMCKNLTIINNQAFIK